MPSSKDPIINRQKAKEWRLANQDKHRESNRAWIAKKRAENPGWAAEEQKKFRARMTPEQKAERAAYQRQWIADHPEYGRDNQRKDHAANPAKRMVEAAKIRAKRLGVAFSLDWREIAIPQRCPVLGLELSPGAEKQAASPSLDRLVPGEGYVPSNVRVISRSANAIKKDKSLIAMEEYADRLRAQLEGAEAVIRYMYRELARKKVIGW